MAEPPWIVTTIEQVAEFFGVSPNTVRTSWRKNGMPGKRGRWDLREIYHWLQSRSTGGRNETADASRREADRQKAWADASIQLMKAQTMRGELIEVATICRDTIHAFTTARAMLEQTPFRLLGSLPADISGDDKRRFLNQANKCIQDTMECLHSWLKQWAEKADGSEPLPVPPELEEQVA